MAASSNKQAVIDFVSQLLRDGSYQVVLSTGEQEIRIVPVAPGTVPPCVQVTPDGWRVYTPPIPWLRRSFDAKGSALHPPRSREVNDDPLLGAETAHLEDHSTGNKEMEAEP